MNDLHIAPSNETPEIDFRFSEHRLVIRGESYPENALSFYAPIRNSLQDYLTSLDPGDKVNVAIALRYFNSASTKLIRALVAMLNAAALAGKQIALDWYHDEDDDMMLEFGLDLQEEHTALKYHAVATMAS
ncbi:MAG TPA: DUF1987 domain-containing protein [Rhodocyclaceae bacterium]|nr:DUF1987 domain-containing protein [Rhodocyclaceae bacterium]